MARGDRIYIHEMVKCVLKEGRGNDQNSKATCEKNVLKPIEPIECIKEHELVIVIPCPHHTKKGLRELAETLTYEVVGVIQKLIDEEFDKIEGAR